MHDQTRPSCHPDRRHAAHQLCYPCYSKYRIAVRRQAIKPADCHPDRGVYALGLCTACYFRQRLRRRKAGEGRRATCHPDRPYAAHGWCYACYYRYWYRSPMGRLYNARADVRRKRLECSRRWAARPENRAHIRAYRSRPEVRATRRRQARERYRIQRGLPVVPVVDQRTRQRRAGYRTRCRRRAAYMKARARRTVSTR